MSQTSRSSTIHVFNPYRDMIDASKARSTAAMTEPIKVLLFTKTSAYRHASIPALATSLSSIPWLSLTHTEDSALLQSSLPTQDILILGHNTGDFLDDESLAAVKRFTETEGKGVVGVHACTAGMLECDWYSGMLGARFDGHPEPQWGRVRLHRGEQGEAEHTILRGLPEPSSSSVPANAPPCPSRLLHSSNQHPKTDFAWFDEWYNFTATPKFPPEESTVLVSVDPTTYEGGPSSEMVGESGLHPLAWCHEVNGGGTRVFYTALGHFDEACSDPWFMQMLHNGIRWAARVEE
ncbi:trehalose utilization domain-containing protein [Sarocladium implicatum]|nr:trehalose utilization domain-containing protein [Sarocladium implicatum]